ncbi:FecR domain-containing protein [Janthinobacterium sp. PAMC25594]|uniref:FecR family protein n=1 Tax=Janthinobacterium sp. PAMC25594 TaxID=2861284 RepID=UPI001C630A94|nr:FecR domain-containing protein [Janthinobacterium sp. PAMC25594]QYG06169.1 FecR domain-containing protein [Janthinobacterium sp. PAMC25594]
MTALPPRHAFGPSAQEQADLREHAAFAATQDGVALAAATWFSRRHDLDAHSQVEFAAWLAADARHAQAYAQLRDTHRAARTIPAQVAARWTVPQAPSAPVSAPRRHWLRALPYAAAAMLLLSVGAGGYQWWQQPTFSQSYAAMRGQRLAVALPDGSKLQLDTATQLHVTLYRQRREVRLAHGEALFQVQAKQGQAFDVLSGPVTVTVVGTQFSVRNTLAEDGQLRVAVQHGHVRMAGARQEQVDLMAGQGVTADAAGNLSAVASLAPGSVAPWRDGRITFDNVPLGAALAEFERYGDTGLVARDPAVARLRIGGSFSLTQLDRFAAALPQLLPVHVVRDGAVSEIRMAAKMPAQAPAMRRPEK